MKAYPTENHEVVDSLMATMGACSRSLEKLRAVAEQETAKVKARFSPMIGQLEARVKELDAAIKKREKRDRAVLFADADRVELRHGTLLYSVERKVKKAKGVLQKLKDLAMKGAVKVAESVDWDELEKWPDEKLLMVGTKRQRVETFSYELKD